MNNYIDYHHMIESHKDSIIRYLHESDIHIDQISVIDLFRHFNKCRIRIPFLLLRDAFNELKKGE